MKLQKDKFVWMSDLNLYYTQFQYMLIINTLSIAYHVGILGMGPINTFQRHVKPCT